MDAILGRGGATSVYRVRDPREGKIYALKVVSAADRAAVSNLEREGRILARLDHPNLLAAHAVVRHDSRVGVALEFVDGPDLRHWIDDVRPDLALAIEVFHGVVRGLTVVHKAGLVHCDLKPENILLAVDGDAPLPKIGDFGLVTSTGQRIDNVVGTARYLAPESWNVPRAADPRSDLFGLGCILYEIVCFRPAFNGPNPDSVRKLAAAKAYPRPDRLSPGLPVGIVDLIDLLLDPDPNRRAADCQAVLDTLDRQDLLHRLAYLPPLPVRTTGRTGWEGEISPGSVQTPGLAQDRQASASAVSWMLLLLPISLLVFGLAIALMTAAMTG